VLLTLAASSLSELIKPKRSRKVRLELLDLPAFARQDLGLHGLALSTDLLAGVDRDSLLEIRDRADKVGCACLLLADPNPLGMADADIDKAEAAIDRASRVLRAASLLGCNSAAIAVRARDDEEDLAVAADRLRETVRVAEQLELNLLLTPTAGLTSEPDKVTELIKRVGGFRLGTYPDFSAAHDSGDAVRYLRRLAPYASIVCASTVSFVNAKSGEPAGDDLAEEVKHEPFELAPLVEAVQSVGYQGTLALDYRGKGDATLGLHRSRAALEELLNPEGKNGR